jgi:hypothetical protein
MVGLWRFAYFPKELMKASQVPPCQKRLDSLSMAFLKVGTGIDRANAGYFKRQYLLPPEGLMFL